VTVATLLPSDVGAALELQELTYAWKGDPLTPERTKELELMVARALQAAKTLQLAWSMATRDGSIWEQAAYARRIKAISFLAAVVADILGRTQDNLKHARLSYPDSAEIPNAAELEPNLKTVRDIEAKVWKTLERLNGPTPPVNEEMLRRSQQSIDRGKGERITEIIARVETGGPVVKE
jgi:hypothetical protein